MFQKTEKNSKIHNTIFQINLNLIRRLSYFFQKTTFAQNLLDSRKFQFDEAYFYLSPLENRTEEYVLSRLEKTLLYFVAL